MTDLNLNEIYVLALALEIVETEASIGEIPAILEDNRFITTKRFSAYDLHVVKRKPLDLAAGLFNKRQIRAIQIKNVVKYLEENTVYVPEDWGRKPKEKEVSYEEARWVCEKYQAKQKDDPHSQYSLNQVKALATGNLEILKPGQW